MFGNKKEDIQESSSRPASSGASSINNIGAGTKVEGTIQASGDIRIDGQLVGTLICKGRLIIGSSGEIDGKVECKNAIIEGFFKGNLKVSEVLSIKESAKVNGEINTNQLIVQSGAIFNVSCAMGGQKISQVKNKNIASK